MLVEAKSYGFRLNMVVAVLLIIGMQRDFLKPAASAKCWATMFPLSAAIRHQRAVV